MKKIIKNYLRPFWFSSKCNEIKPPYFYGFCLQMAFFIGVYLFFRMAWHNYPAPVLGVMSAVIGTLAGLYFGVLSLFDKAKK